MMNKTLSSVLLFLMTVTVKNEEVNDDEAVKY